ncbi:MAG TPA: ABC transporter permease [Solirubrobacterales bacterium]|nr:ABC transporter permease [Solirubrobacterales bacterium]
MGDDKRRLNLDSRVARIAVPAVFALLMLAIWQLYTVVSDVPESSLPSPIRIVEAGWESRDLLLDNTWVTAGEILIGFTAAIVLGVLLAILIRSSRTVERALYPWLVASQMVPVVALAPIFVIWTGFDLRPKVMVIALVAFFPIAVNTIDGLRAVDPQLLRLLRTLRASRWQRFRYARAPAALPFLFSGLKVAAALAVIGAVFGEWVGASEGLGYLILVLNNATDTATMFATIFVLALIGIALFGLVILVERLLLPWYHEARTEPGDGPEEART